MSACAETPKYTYIKEDTMKKVLIEQRGEEVLSHLRYFYVEMPDDIDLTATCPIGDLVETLADRKGVVWTHYVSDGIVPMCCSVVKDDLDAEDSRECSVITVTRKMVDAVSEVSNPSSK
jgi:hypothetical protein